MKLKPSFSKRRWLLLPIELPVRELSSRLLVACLAIERGYGVVIGRKRDMANRYWALPRGVILDKSLAVVRQTQFRRLREYGYRIAATEEESVWAYREPSQFLRMRVTESNIALADFYFTWGRKQADIIANAYPPAERILRNTGTPRLDVLRPEFSALYAGDANAIKARHGRFILLPSNFSMVIDRRGGRDFYTKMRERHAGTVSQDDGSELDRMLNHIETNLHAFVDVFPKILDAFPDHDLVIRPHPGDDIGFWERVAENQPRIKVRFEGSVLPWLLAADATFHHGCTTGVESYFMNRPAVAYHPDFNAAYDNHMSTWLGPIADSSDALISLLKSAVAGDPLPREDLSWFQEYFYSEADELASERIVNALDELELPESNPFSSSIMMKMNLLKIQSFIRSLYRHAKRRMKGKKREKIHIQEDWSSINSMYFHDLIDVMKIKTKNKTEFQVDCIDDKIFIIT